MNGDDLATLICNDMGITDADTIAKWKIIANRFVNYWVNNCTVTVTGVQSGSDSATGTVS